MEHTAADALAEIYDDQPDLRPTPERVATMARRVGIAMPHEGHEVA